MVSAPWNRISLTSVETVYSGQPDIRKLAFDQMLILRANQRFWQKVLGFLLHLSSLFKPDGLALEAAASSCRERGQVCKHPLNLTTSLRKVTHS